MRLNASPISQHRLNRHHRWMLLWLTWVAAFLNEARAFAPFSAQATAIAHQWLDRIERLLVDIVLIRAAPHVRGLNPPKHSPRRRKETQFQRAFVGSAMRCALRSRDLSRRMAALSQNVDDLVARVLKRLPRGLTRRRPHHTRPEPRVIERAIVYANGVAPDDTS